METLTLEHMHMDGRLQTLLSLPVRYLLLFFRYLIISPQHVADLIGADPKEIVFTSGATEANNMCIKGAARFYKDKKNHVITTVTVSIHERSTLLIVVVGA